MASTEPDGAPRGGRRATGSGAGRARERREADYVVVGAGFSGLAAARRLEDRGAHVTVLEARGEVGGRTICRPIGGGKIVELGGEYLGRWDIHSLELARTLGDGIFETYDRGANVADIGGVVRRYHGFAPWVAPHALADLGQLLWRFDRLARRAASLDLGSADARRLDAETLATWVEPRLRTRAARSLMEIITGGVWGCEASEISLLAALRFTGITAHGRLEYMIRTTGGAQQWRYRGGPQALAERLARTLREPVELESPVRVIERERDRVRVRCDDLEVVARRAIVALPPNMAAKIAYDPGLPGARDHLVARTGPGAIIKMMALYDEPFWRAENLSGQALTDFGPVGVVFDNSPPDGSPGVLMPLAFGRRAREMATWTPAQRRAVVVQTLVRLFGPRAARLEGFVEHDWAADPWARGCYHSFTSPGLLSQVGAHLRIPVGRIHWAGAETGAEPGGISGAIEAGRRAADEALEQEGGGDARPVAPAGERATA